MRTNTRGCLLTFTHAHSGHPGIHTKQREDRKEGGKRREGGRKGGRSERTKEGGGVEDTKIFMK